MFEKVKAIGFIVLLGAVCASLLVVVDSFTSPLIERNQVMKLKVRVLEAFSLDFNETNVEEVFASEINVNETAGQTFYSTSSGAIGFEIKGSGVWGPIHAVLAIKPDKETVHGISIVHQEETPGLGGRIGEKEFLDRFSGRKLVPAIKIVVPGSVAADNEVDGITGATMSVAAFQEIINTNFKKLELAESL